jgi:hypothetical protein
MPALENACFAIRARGGPRHSLYGGIFRKYARIFGFAGPVFSPCKFFMAERHQKQDGAGAEFTQNL